jgi:signal transduction histidine kinase
VGEAFVGVLGHDLRNPLSAVTTAASLIELRADSDKISKPVRRILLSAARLERMLTQILDFVRLRAGAGLLLERASVDLAAVCRSAIDELEPGLAAWVTLESSGDCGGEWDGDRAAQMVSNLVLNACQHGVAGHPVRVRVDGNAPDTVSVAVENSGIVPPDLLPVIFEPLGRRAQGRQHRSERTSGLGLGLYIAREVVLAHGGTICVESNDVTGTRFLVELPRRSHRSAAPSPAADPAR